MLYSLSHEISQRAVISDKALTSLQNFVDVLVKYFPGRKNTIKFLQELQTFVRAHEDMIRGEDLQVQYGILLIEFRGICPPYAIIYFFLKIFLVVSILFERVMDI